MDQTKTLRRQVYWLLIAVAAAAAVGRVLSTERVYEPHLAPPAGEILDGHYQAWPETAPRAMPTFGSNDRSRWDTVRALVDDGTFVIGRRDRSVVLRTGAGSVFAADPLQAAVLQEVAFYNRTERMSNTGIAFNDGWFSVDKVLDPQRLEFLSSKPPLLTVLMAGQYWLLKNTLGWSIDEHPYEVVRVGLLTFNVLPFVLYLWLLARLAERYGATDWGRLLVVTAAAFGTLLTPFLITFNNHAPAAFAALAAQYATLSVAFPPSPKPGPIRLTTDAGRLAFAGLAAGFLINCELPGALFAAALMLLLLVRAPGRTLLWFAPPLLALAVAFFALNYLATGQLLPVYDKLDTPWYQYEGSVWHTIHPGEGGGIEFAKFAESRWTYALHLLVGHHGWFSLTPINLLGAAGMTVGVLQLWKRWNDVKQAACPAGWNITAAGSLAVSLVVFVFYAFIVETANYGGWTNGPRWLLWLTPLWLFAMLPVADWLGRRRWGQALCLALLALSVLSASYSAWNPWRHPWIYSWMDSQGWLPY